MANDTKLPEGYGAAAPAYAKKKGGAAGKGSYIKFLSACRKQGKSMAECSKEWKAKGAGGGKTVRRRAARILRKAKGGGEATA